MNHYYAYFVVFCVLAYFIATDPSIAKAFTLLTQIITFQYEKIKFLILHHPANPIVSWMINRRAWENAKILQKEIEAKRNLV